MALIDGKYEVLAQQDLGANQTLLTATDPDGTALHIVWFDLETPQQEAEFEHYRQLLRALKRAGLAALHEVVARPGATYVAWGVAQAGRVPPRQELEALLAEYGYRPEQADIRGSQSGQGLVYGLTFGGTLVPTPETTPTPAADAVAQRSLSTLPLWLWRWGLGGLLALLGLTLLYASFRRGMNDTLVSVPDLGGQEVNAAARTLYDTGLTALPGAEASDALPYAVLRSEPPAGTMLRPGQTVRLIYGLPAGQVALTEVPELRGQAYSSEVAASLEATGLRLGDVAYLYSSVKPDVIIAQSTPAGSQLNAGSPLHLLVSAGPKPEETFLPDLTGLPYDDAVALARLAGVAVSEPETRPDARALPGTVLAQSILPYTLVGVRDAVLRLTVAGQADPQAAAVGTPSLVGMSLSQARTVATTAGYRLEVNYLEDETDSLNLPGGVVGQTPAPGSAPAGDILSVLVNQRPVAIPVPVATAQHLLPQERTLNYTFPIEAGIPEIDARVTATTIGGTVYPVAQTKVRGGQALRLSWRTREPGPITLTLYLGGEPYLSTTLNP